MRQWNKILLAPFEDCSRLGTLQLSHHMSDPRLFCGDKIARGKQCRPRLQSDQDLHCLLFLLLILANSLSTVKLPYSNFRVITILYILCPYFQNFSGYSPLRFAASTISSYCCLCLSASSGSLEGRFLERENIHLAVIYSNVRHNDEQCKNSLHSVDGTNFKQRPLLSNFWFSVSSTN